MKSVMFDMSAEEVDQFVAEENFDVLKAIEQYKSTRQ